MCVYIVSLDPHYCVPRNVFVYVFFFYMLSHTLREVGISPIKMHRLCILNLAVRQPKFMLYTYCIEIRTARIYKVAYLARMPFPSIHLPLPLTPRRLDIQIAASLPTVSPLFVL